MNEIVRRIKGPTPKFWRKAMKLGMGLIAIGAAIATAPVSLPAAVIAAGGYIATAGTVLTIAAGLTVETPTPKK